MVNIMYNERRTIKPIIIRMEIFNTVIFYTIYDNHSNSNKDMNNQYCDRAFNNLFELGIRDKFISETQLTNFYIDYAKNMYTLYNKIYMINKYEVEV